ncbi:MAG: hypothetical protein KDA68_16645 [Planctomycetaceae bacterium]|nr:hypothetical protein [Planctomycetaceae bacterium]
MTISETSEPSTPTTKSKSKSKLRRWIALGLLLVVAVGTFGLLRPILFQRGRNKILSEWQDRGVYVRRKSAGPGWLKQISPYLADLVGKISPQVTVISDLKGTFTDDDFQKLPQFPELERLKLFESKLTESAWGHIGRCRRLMILEISYVPLSKSSLQNVSNLKQVHSLLLEHTGICDDDLAPLADLSGLRSIYLHEPRITDAGLKMMQEWKSSLYEVNVRGSKVTLKAAKEFMKSKLPTFSVVHIGPEIPKPGRRPRKKVQTQ